MLIKIDNTVASLLAEDRADVVIQLTNSKRMYGWVEGEVIGDTIDSFALTNPKATFGDFIEWTKRTYMDRLRAHRDGVKYNNFSLKGDYNPTRPTDPGQGDFAKHGVTAINDAAPSRPKVRTDLRRVDEAQADADDAAALAAEAELGEQKDGPGTPDFAELQKLPPIEQGQRPDEPDIAPVEDPLAKFRNSNKK